MVRWAYGVTTVPQRRKDLLPRTLMSLRHAGFESPRLFVDGVTFTEATGYEAEFGLPVTAHANPPLRTHGNWVLGLYELYIRDIIADRFVIFQDDIVTYPNLRKYLERVKLPELGYFNMFSSPSQEEYIKATYGAGPNNVGWFQSTQFGRGALGLMFTRQAVIELLSARHLVDRVNDPHRGHRAVDGGIVESMKKAGWAEYIHYPALVQHTGLETTMGSPPHRESTTFAGERFDALNLLRGTRDGKALEQAKEAPEEPATGSA